MSNKVDWTKPVEVNTAPGTWLPCKVLYVFKDGGAAAVLCSEADGREWVNTLHKSHPRVRNAPETVERVVYLNQRDPAFYGDKNRDWYSVSRLADSTVASARVTFTIGEFAEEDCGI